MKKAILSLLLICSLFGTAQAATIEEDWASTLDNTVAKERWVYIATKDKSNLAVTPDKIHGLDNKGDVVVILDAVPGEEPTLDEKEEFQILVADLTDLEVQLLLSPYYIDETLGPNDTRLPKAHRKYKVDLTKMNKQNLKGFDKQKIKIEKRLTTPQEIAMYNWNQKKYAYLVRPIKIAMNMITPPAFAADNISKICAVGANCTDENYNSVGAWESAKGGDLVTATTREIGELYDDDGNFNEDWTIGGSTTNSSYYMYLRAGSGEEHSGVFGDGVNTSQNSTFVSAAAISDDYTRLEGFTIIQDNYVSYDALNILSGANNVLLNRMIIANTQTWGGEEARGFRMNCSPACDITAENTIFALEQSGTFTANISSGSTFTGYQSTWYGESATERSFCEAVGTCNLYGCLIYNYDLTNCDAGDYNMTTDTNSCGGGNELTSKVAGDFDFTDTTENAWDLHIADTSDAYNSGNDYSGSMTNDADVDQDTRSGTWDRGADEVAGGGGGSTFKPLIILSRRIP